MEPVGIFVGIIAGIAAILLFVFKVIGWIGDRLRGSGEGRASRGDDESGGSDGGGQTNLGDQNPSASGGGIAVGQAGSVTINRGGVDQQARDDIERIKKELQELAERLSPEGVATPQTEDLAEQATTDTEEMLGQALAFVNEGRYQDAIEHVLSAYDHDLPPRAREQLYLLAGSAYQRLSDYKAAEDYYDRVLTIARDVSDRAAEAAALSNLGIIYRIFGKPERSEVYLSMALEIDRDLGSKDVASDLGNLGIIYLERGDFDQAAGYFADSLEGHRESGDLHGQASQLGNLGLLAKLRRDIDGAADYYKQALDIFTTLRDLPGQAGTLGNLGVVRQHQGRLDEAQELFERALRINETLGAQYEIANQLGSLGRVAKERGDSQEAAELFERALRIFRDIDHKLGQAAALSNLGELWLEAGDLPQAREALQETEAIGRQLENKPLVADTLINLGKLRLVEGDTPGSLKALREALDLFELIGDAENVSLLSRMIAEVEEGKND